MLAEQVRTVITSPNQASTTWVTSQYDRFVRGNTALFQPDDAGVVRVDEATCRGVAISTDANGRFIKLDPATGAAQALAESLSAAGLSATFLPATGLPTAALPAAAFLFHAHRHARAINAGAHG